MEWIGEAMSWASRLTNTRACFSCSRSVTSNERARSFPSSNTHPFRLLLFDWHNKMSVTKLRVQHKVKWITYLTSLCLLSFVRNDFQVCSNFRKHYKLKTNKRVRRLPSTVLFSITSARPSLRKKRLNFFFSFFFCFFFSKKGRIQ